MTAFVNESNSYDLSFLFVYYFNNFLQIAANRHFQGDPCLFLKFSKEDSVKHIIFVNKIKSQDCDA